MAGKHPKSKPNCERESGTPLLDRLTGAEGASLLRILLDRHTELQSEAESIAQRVLTEVTPFEVADEVADAVCQYDSDDLNGRAGGHSWGYVEPGEAAWELLEEAVEPFVVEMKRYLELGLEDAARRYCQGILLGLYRAAGAANDVLGWAEDFPSEAASNALDERRSASGAGKQGAPEGRKRRAMPPDFVRKHLPDWEWVLKPSANTQ